MRVQQLMEYDLNKRSAKHINKSTLVARVPDTGHTKRRATIGRPRGNGRPHSQRCHRSVSSMFKSFVVVCASDRKYWRLIILLY